MTWVKLDDQLHAHPKAARAWALCDASLGLHMLAMSYSGCFDTHGLVDEVFVAGKIPGAARRRKAVDALVTAGLWKPVDGGWQIHDWTDYNGDAETREAARKAKQEAGRKGGRAKAAALAAASESSSSELAGAKQKPSSRAGRPLNPAPYPQLPPHPLPGESGTERPKKPPRPKFAGKPVDDITARRLHRALVAFDEQAATSYAAKPVTANGKWSPNASVVLGALAAYPELDEARCVAVVRVALRPERRFWDGDRPEPRHVFSPNVIEGNLAETEPHQAVDLRAAAEARNARSAQELA